MDLSEWSLDDVLWFSTVSVRDQPSSGDSEVQVSILQKVPWHLPGHTQYYLGIPTGGPFSGPHYRRHLGIRHLLLYALTCSNFACYIHDINMMKLPGIVANVRLLSERLQHAEHASHR